MNAHLIRITYVPATDSKPSRVRLTSQRFERNAITIPYDYCFSTISDTARNWLESHGYTIVCSGEMPGGYWAAIKEFEPLRKRA